MNSNMYRGLVLVSLVGLLMSCGGSKSTSSNSSTTVPTPTPTISGTPLQGLAACEAQKGVSVICGTVLAADGETPITGASVTLADGNTNSLIKGLVADGRGFLESNPSACETDDAGAFACLIDNCSGEATFAVETPLFSSPLQFTATCQDSEVTQVDKSKTTATPDLTNGNKWLVVPGSFDGVQLLLSQIKGCTLTGNQDYPDTLRGSTECEAAGLTVLDDQAAAATYLASNDLSQFQAIFVNCSTDISYDEEASNALKNYTNNGGNTYFSDLSDSWLEFLFPDLITWPEDRNDTDSGTLSNMTVADSGLGVFLGSATTPKTSMDIIFDFGVWTAMESVKDSWTVYIEGDINPLASTLTGTRPITAGGPQESGCVFYTSYHVEGAAIGSDQEKALKYLVLNRMNNCQ